VKLDFIWSALEPIMLKEESSFHHHQEAEKETEQIEMKSKISHFLSMFFKSYISPFLLNF
jgi:hypothetical protein